MGSAPTTNLLRNVVARLPQESLAISGQLHVRRARGIPVANYGFEMRINWGDTPPGATYTISTTDGIPLEQLSLTRLTDGEAQCRYFEGATLEPKDAPPLSHAIRDTDISWTDLTLDFLWWPRCVLVGEDSVRGRAAIVADVYYASKCLGQALKNVLNSLFKCINIYSENNMLTVNSYHSKKVCNH